MLATTMGVVLPLTASAYNSTDVIAVPVLLNFGTYSPANEAILNAIGNRISKSQFITNNVDSSTALIIKGRFIATKNKGRMVSVIYSWAGKTVTRRTYLCSKTQIGRCSAAIVLSAEKAAIVVRQSPYWLWH